jgi:hypothetical protein
MLSYNFILEHFRKTLVNFFPAGHSTDIIEHRGGLLKTASFLHMLDESNASEVHVVLIILHSSLFVNAFGQILT